MNNILPAIIAGLSAGGILLFLSHIAPLFKAGNFVRDLDQPVLFGKTITRREAHFVGIFTYIVLSAVFGGLFGFLVNLGVVPDFSFIPIIIWGVVLTVLYGGIIMPIEGHGFFGLKEDTWFPIDLIITNLLWAILFWWLIGLWYTFAI
ncbi:MAG: hypothetical protein ABII13_02595 [Patescibacteria group bacterium]|nr:hypothetical protein [Patescibacteria group bacterium]